MFDYEAFADEMYKQSKELIPADFSEKDKKYISTTISNFVKLAGESLNNDKENDFSDEQKVFITQVIAEWTFHKSIDLIRAEIPDKYWDAILQKIAYTIFEIAKQAIVKDMSQQLVLDSIEFHVKKVYKESIEELPVNDEQKRIASEQSNIDKMAFEAKENNKFNWVDILERGLHIVVLFAIGFVASIFSFLIYAQKISHSQYSFLIIGLILITYIAYFIKHKLSIKKQENELEDVRQQMQDLVNPDKMYERLGMFMIIVVNSMVEVI